MSAAENGPSVAQPRSRGRRDGLGQLCFHHHFVVMIYIVTGWLIPWWPALVFYAVFLPAVAIQWWVNQNSCVLNNLESLLRTGRWRDPTNREEGAWLATLAHDVLGIRPTPLQMDIFTYAVLAVLWLAGLSHLRGW